VNPKSRDSIARCIHRAQSLSLGISLRATNGVNGARWPENDGVFGTLYQGVESPIPMFPYNDEKRFYE
jgi:hypothetical protein